MKFHTFVIVVAIVVLLTASVEARRRRHGRHRKPHRDEGNADDWKWPSPKGWKNFLDRLMGRSGRQSFGVGLGTDSDQRFNFDFGWNLQKTQWWKGPNVCTIRKEMESNTTGPSSIARHFSYHSQVCDETEFAYRCTTKSRVMDKQKTVTKIFECCHGFTRKESEYGCPKKHELDDLVETARKLGLSEFLRATDRKSLTEELKQGNFTVFAPVNDAFQDIGTMLPEIKQIMPKEGVVMVSKSLSDQVLTDMQNLLLGHLVVGNHKTSNLADEQLVQTGSPYKSNIRINFYEGPEKLMTANCVKVISADNQATNGVIHLVSSLLQPVTGTLVDIISKSPQLRILKTALARAKMVQKFRAEGKFTLFAPTDDAFRKVDPDLLEKFLKGDQECLQKVLNSHVLPNVICSEVIQGQAKSRNLLHTFLNLTRNEDNKLFVNGAQIVHRDIMVSNGVIHVIDEVIIPEQALRVTDLMQEKGATEMLNHLKKAKLLTEFTKTSNITVFVPSNTAFQNLPSEIMRKLRSDLDFLSDVIKFHVVPERLSLDRVYNNLRLDTTLDQKRIRINEYSLFPFGDKWTQTAQCAPIITKNIKSCNGIINIIDKVMVPPPGNIVDVLALDPRFTKFIELVKKAGIADSLQEEGPLTLFAPTNDAFLALGDNTMKMLTYKPGEINRVLENHIAKDALCCAGIFKSGWYGSPRLRTRSGQVFRLDRQPEQIMVGPATITQCDITGTNGVVHVINRVLVYGSHDIWGSPLGRERGSRRRGTWRRSHSSGWL